jgi:membrane fusion protein (multidrug efflux system)
MKRKYVIIIIVLAIVALIAFNLAANKKTLNEKDRPASASSVNIPVKVAAVHMQVLDFSIRKTGSLAPFKEAKVLSPTSGTIQYLKFELGTKVSEGQIIALMDNHLLQLDLQKAQTNLNKQESDLHTYTDLYNGKAATQEKLNEIRQDYSDALNQYNQVKKQISDAAIKAPTSGIISVKNVEQGVYVNAGAEIATVVNVARAKVQVNLTENEVYQVHQDQHVQITTDVYPGKVFDGAVSFVSPQADATHSYMVEILIDTDPKYVLHSGTFVNADFIKKSNQNVLVIPRDALAESVQNASVYVVEGNKVHQKNIVTGRQLGDMVEVLSGLNNDEEVVVSGQINLKDGTPVSVSK